MFAGFPSTALSCGVGRASLQHSYPVLPLLSSTERQASAALFPAVGGKVGRMLEIIHMETVWQQKKYIALSANVFGLFIETIAGDLKNK